MSQTSYLEKYGTVAGAPWQEGKAPIVRFVTDDHKVIGVMFGHITRTYEDRSSNYLMVSSSAGLNVIKGLESAHTMRKCPTEFLIGPSRTGTKSPPFSIFPLRN